MTPLSPVSVDERKWRLQRIAQEYGIEEPPEPTPLSRASATPSPSTPRSKNPEHDTIADDLLRRRRIAIAQGENGNGSGKGLREKRSFTLTRSNSFANKEIFEALDAHVANHGSPEVAEALVHKLIGAGGDLNNASNKSSKMSFHLRRRSLDDVSKTQSRILQKAVEGSQEDMVSVLVPHADGVTIDSVLPLALEKGNYKITETLLSYGANLSATPEGQFSFNQLCINGEHAELVGLLLRSDGRPPPLWISGAMVQATRRGDVDTVMRLSRSVADGCYNDAEALKAAITMCRVDIVLAILTGKYPPTREYINEAFRVVFSHANIMPTEKKSFAEILLLAGAEGDVVSEALVQACDTEFYEMIDLLIGYGASIEYDEASAVRNAIQRGNLTMVELLLSDGAALSPTLASQLVESIPKRISTDNRRTLLTVLLRKGANGPYLGDALLDAVETQDFECVKLLLQPLFPGSGRLQPRAKHDIKRGPRSMHFERHAIADVNHKGGLALSLAVNTGHIGIVDCLLAAKPDPEILVEVFPHINRLEPQSRLQMTESFLAAGVSGPCVHDALQHAIDENPPRRDERLIKILLGYDVDANANKGAPVLSAIEHRDADLLEVLLQKTRLNPRNAAVALQKAMDADNQDAKRARMVSLLLLGGADAAEKVVGDSMIKVLQEQPSDLILLKALLVLGKADVNMSGGDPLVMGKFDPPLERDETNSLICEPAAVRNQDPSVLELMLQVSKPTAETMDMAVQAMSKIPSTKSKSVKLESILKRTKQKETLNGLLPTEVDAIIQCPPETRTLVVLKALLAAGVDVNTQRGSALCRAVAGGNSVITDVLLATKPSAASLQAAMPCALKIPDQTDRLAFTTKLLNAGAPALEVNQALIHAIGAYPDDFPLLNRLVAGAETSDGEALLKAVKGGRPVLVELILARTKKLPTERLNAAFAEAVKLRNPGDRKAICELLLEAGATGHVVSDALLAAAGSGDLTFGNLLLDHGASVDHQAGQSVVEACRAGSSDVLKMLVSSKATVNKETLERGFQAATEVGDLKQRADVFQMLLDKGVSGGVVDAQLVSAARFGDDAIDLVGLLLKYGASTDYNDGEAIYNATRCAFSGILAMMLGVAPVGGKQQRPSPDTLIRALKASTKLSCNPRYQVMKWLFEVGVPVVDDVHLALNQAVNEEDASMDLIKLLLDNGASPTAEGCKALIDAAKAMNFPVTDLFLRGNIAEDDLAWIFQQTFSPTEVDVWLSEPGLQMAQRLADAGARGEGVSGVLVIAMDYLGTDKDEAARKFIGLLIQYNADINQGQGEALVKAAKSADPVLIQQMMQQRPDAESLSMALPYLFDHEASEEEALELVILFTDYRDGETRLDPMFVHPESEPVVFKALQRYPRSTKIITALLDAGYYHDQIGKARILDEVEEEEQVNLLIWCLLQPQKRISSGIITLLIDKGARVNFETTVSKTTPLMLAIKEKRHDIVKQLVLAGAEVDVADVMGNTPLTLATQVGGELGTMMMSNVLAAEPSQNDGSLHNAARDLNLKAMQVLVDFGHEVDFPSPLHDGRTALGELCLHAAETAPVTATQEKTMEKAISYLIREGTDLSLLADGKSVLLLAMHSADPVPTTRALLKVAMWKHINRSWNYYNDGLHTYSPTQYVKHVMPQSDTTEQLLKLLKANRAQDVYFANEGPQPEGAIGLPDDIVRAERERKARLERIQLEAEDHARTLARTKEVADIQNSIFTQRVQLEDARSRQKQNTEMDGIRERAALEEALFNDAVRRKRAERAAAMDHESSLTQAEAERKRLVAETELDAEEKKQRLLLQFESRLGEQRHGQAVQMSAVRRAERENVSAFEKEQDNRVRGRMAQEKKLIESRTQMAASLQGLGVPQRQQIGYVSGELD